MDGFNGVCDHHLPFSRIIFYGTIVSVCRWGQVHEGVIFLGDTFSYHKRKPVGEYTTLHTPAARDLFDGLESLTGEIVSVIV